MLGYYAGQDEYERNQDSSNGIYLRFCNTKNTYVACFDLRKKGVNFTFIELNVYAYANE
jgi:hypothetical protein